MRRRDIIVGGMAAFTLPFPVLADQRHPAATIGIFFGSFYPGDPTALLEIEAFKNGLAEFGLYPDQNLVLRYAWGGGNAVRITELATELANSNAQLILSRSTPTTLAIARATERVPILFVQVSDPVGDGLVSSMAHPNENITGFTNIESSTGGKWIELVKELAPRTRQTRILVNSATAPGRGSFFLPAMYRAASEIGMACLPVQVETAEGIQREITNAAQASEAIIINPGAFLAAHMKQIVGLAAERKVVAVYPYAAWSESGGLISYGANTPDLFRRAALYVRRILDGEAPRNLPVQAPTAFELTLNLRAAQALEMPFSTSLLARADRVIE